MIRPAPSRATEVGGRRCPSGAPAPAHMGHGRPLPLHRNEHPGDVVLIHVVRKQLHIYAAKRQIVHSVAPRRGSDCGMNQWAVAGPEGPRGRIRGRCRRLRAEWAGTRAPSTVSRYRTRCCPAETEVAAGKAEIKPPQQPRGGGMADIATCPPWRSSGQAGCLADSSSSSLSMSSASDRPAPDRGW